MFSKILQQIGNKEMVDNYFLSGGYVLWIGCTLAYFQESENKPELIQSLKIIWRGIATSTADNLSIATDIPSQPRALLELKLLIMLTSWLLVTDTWDNDTSVLDIEFGKILPLSLIVHWFAKYWLKISAFCLQLEIWTPLSIMGGNFLIGNFFISGPKMFLSCVGIGEFRTQASIIS